MLETLESSQLAVSNGGKAEEVFQLSWLSWALGAENGTDNILIKDNFLSEGYIVYKTNEVTSIDVRGYRSVDCTAELLISVSADGEDWTALDAEAFTRTDSELPQGPIHYAYQSNEGSIPAGMNYVKIEIPELAASEYELSISDIQILYTGEDDPSGDNGNSGDNGDNGDNNEENPNTGVALPLAALALAGASVAVVLISRKRCHSK